MIKKCHFGNWSRKCPAFFRNLISITSTTYFQSKRLRNPERNAWKSSTEIIISNGGVNAIKNTNGFQFQNVYAVAEKGFPISVADCRMDHFPGTICYYYEVKILKSALW
jgi:hypothetical protein